jgi:uncharacterized protein
LASITTPHRASRNVLWLVLIGVLAVILFSILPFPLLIALGPKLNLLATVFLGIFIEALPYLLIGTLIFGIVEVFVDRAQIIRFVSNRPLRAAVTSALMGPVCEYQIKDHWLQLFGLCENCK